MELGFCSVNLKKKGEKQANTHAQPSKHHVKCDLPSHLLLQKKSEPYQTSLQTFIPYCFVLGFGMSLSTIILTW